MKKILIVEDNDDVQYMYRIVFRKSTERGVAIAALVDCAEKAFQKLTETNPDLIIIDISLPGTDGITLTSQIKKLYPHIKIIIASAYDRDVYYETAKNAGADDFVNKCDSSELLEKTYQLLQCNSEV